MGKVYIFSVLLSAVFILTGLTESILWNLSPAIAFLLFTGFVVIWGITKFRRFEND